MRKIFAGVIAVVGFFCLAGCSSALDEKSAGEKEGGGATGFVTIALSSGRSERKLDVSSIKTVSYTVESSDMSKMSGTASVASGRGEIAIDKIPVGKNRIISIVSDVSGFEISEVVDIKSGENAISTINWITSARANVYKTLLNGGKKIADFTDEQNAWISSAIPNGKPSYLVNEDLIVSDFATLKDEVENAYVLTYGSVSFDAINANGYVVCINDPCSESKKIDSDDETKGKIFGVAPGTWGYTITDASGSVTTKSVTVRSGQETLIASIGNPLKGKLFVFVKASSAPKIWAWETSGSKVELSTKLNESWNAQPDMQAATELYMANPTGWYMKDFTNANPSGGEIAFKLNAADPEITSRKTATFWYDGKDFYDADPTANQLSDDASLSDIEVNGTSIGAATTNYSVESDVETVTVTAKANDPSARVDVSPSGATAIEAGASSTFTITVTAANGNEKKHALSVRRKVANDTSIVNVKVGSFTASASGSTYTIDAAGASDDLKATVSVTPTDSKATVVCTPSSVSVKDGGSATATITVTNGAKSATYTLIVKYTKRGQSQGGEIFETEYYWTNKNGAVGVEKTISRFSDWAEDMIIAQGAANDDPRAFKGYHEKATDFYALFAAYDKSNLYLMVEMPSIDDRDITSKDWQYALDENLGMGVAINTGKGVPGDGEMDKGITVWNDNKYYSITAGVDTLLMFHPAEYGTPGLFVTNANGKFSYDEPYCKGFKENGIETSREIGLVSGKLYGRSDNYGLTKDEYLAKSDYVDMLVDPQKSNVSGYMYQITIPLAALGIDYDYLTSNGISVMAFSTFGTSMMDALPWCSDLINTAAEAYSKDDSTSQEKEDVDTYNVKLARVGHL